MQEKIKELEQTIKELEKTAQKGYYYSFFGEPTTAFSVAKLCKLINDIDKGEDNNAIPRVESYLIGYLAPCLDPPGIILWRPDSDQKFQHFTWNDADTLFFYNNPNTYSRLVDYVTNTFYESSTFTTEGINNALCTFYSDKPNHNLDNQLASLELNLKKMILNQDRYVLISDPHRPMFFVKQGQKYANTNPSIL